MSDWISAKSLREKRAPLVREMREMVAAAAKEDRELNDEERQEFDRIDTDQESLRKRAEQLEKVEGLYDGLEHDTSAGVAVLPGRENVNQTGAKPDDQAPTARDWQNTTRAFFLGGRMSKGKVDPRLAEQIQQSCKKTGFNWRDNECTVPLLSQAPRTKADIERLQITAGTSPQATTPGPEGGNTIADEAMMPLEVALQQYGGYREYSTTLRTGTGASLPIPTVDGTTRRGQILAENTSAAVGDIAFGQVTLGAHKYTSDMVLVSIELLQDTAIDIVGYIGRELGERLGRIYNQHATVNSTTATGPIGLIASGTIIGSTAVITASSTGFRLSELIDLEHAVDPAYRRNGRFTFHDDTLKILKQMTDGQGRPIWLPGVTTSAPDMLLGYPYTINQDMPTVSGSTTAGEGLRRAIAFGDLSNYWWREVMAIDLLRLDERYANVGQVAFLAFSRADGRPVIAGTTAGSGAYKYLRVST